MLYKILGFLCLGAAIILILSQFVEIVEIVEIEEIEEDEKDD